MELDHVMQYEQFCSGVLVSVLDGEVYGTQSKLPKDLDMSGVEGVTGPVSGAVKTSLMVHCANVGTSTLLTSFWLVRMP